MRMAHVPVMTNSSQLAASWRHDFKGAGLYNRPRTGPRKRAYDLYTKSAQRQRGIAGWMQLDACAQSTLFAALNDVAVGY